MRIAALSLLVLSLAAAAVAQPATSTPTRVSGGSFEMTAGRGKVTLVGSGILVGRLADGKLEITDLSLADQFSPRVRGVPRGKFVSLRGKDVGFYVPGGRYRIVVRGEGISISIRGSGVATLDGDPDPVGVTGMYSVGDQPAVAVPDQPTRVQYGQPSDDSSTSTGSKSASSASRGGQPQP